MDYTSEVRVAVTSTIAVVFVNATITLIGGSWRSRSPMPRDRARAKELYASTDKALRAKVKAWQAELARGLPAADENPTLETVINRWLATKVDLRANSVRDYHQTAARLKKGIGGHHVKVLTDAHIQAWVARLVKVPKAELVDR